jgi:hypothetical protein
VIGFTWVTWVVDFQSCRVDLFLLVPREKSAPSAVGNKTFVVTKRASVKTESDTVRLLSDKLVGSGIITPQARASGGRSMDISQTSVVDAQSALNSDAGEPKTDTMGDGRVYVKVRDTCTCSMNALELVEFRRQIILNSGWAPKRDRRSVLLTIKRFKNKGRKGAIPN